MRLTRNWVLRRLGVPESGISVILIKSSSQELRRVGYSWKRNTGISCLFVIRTIDLSLSGVPVLRLSFLHPLVSDVSIFVDNVRFRHEMYLWNFHKVQFSMWIYFLSYICDIFWLFTSNINCYLKFWTKVACGLISYLIVDYIIIFKRLWLYNCIEYIIIVLNICKLYWIYNIVLNI